ncbi:hypothetical protein YERSI8AC_190001 [Enterobacterales bacterium 8AC]|nr:hypothetical protein YERSI8AC_190001 [Enterobacterales bacterium 8AC]
MHKNSYFVRDEAGDGRALTAWRDKAFYLHLRMSITLAVLYMFGENCRMVQVITGNCITDGAQRVLSVIVTSVLLTLNW